jgi:hypothetical protein
MDYQSKNLDLIKNDDLIDDLILVIYIKLIFS